MCLLIKMMLLFIYINWKMVEYLKFIWKGWLLMPII